MKRCFILVLLAGCDVLLQLDTIKKPEDAGPGADTHPADADTANEFPCADMTHNEDGDRYWDACDKCPTIVSFDGDSDGDGVGNECDPNPTSGDKIGRFYPFLANDPLAVVPDASLIDDELILQNTGSIMTTEQFMKVDEIVLGLKEFDKAAPSSNLVLGITDGLGSVACIFSRDPCNGGGPNTTCLTLKTDGATTSPLVIDVNPAEITGLLLQYDGSNLTCTVAAGGTSRTTPALSSPIPSGTVSVNGTIGPIVAPNLIVYTK